VPAVQFIGMAGQAFTEAAGTAVVSGLAGHRHPSDHIGIADRERHNGDWELGGGDRGRGGRRGAYPATESAHRRQSLGDSAARHP
jgi:hypothetical protein